MSKRFSWVGRRAEVASVTARVSPQEVALREERRRLAEQVAEQTWDLGGLAYEMAVRDHFRVDVLSQRAAGLQRIDARLSEVERLLADHAGIAGNCRFCGSPHGRSAEFCWNCGERLIVRQVPAVIEAVPASEGSAAGSAGSETGTVGSETVPAASADTIVMDAVPGRGGADG